MKTKIYIMRLNNKCKNKQFDLLDSINSINCVVGCAINRPQYLKNQKFFMDLRETEKSLVKL